jgi:hypothetical protein
LGEAGMLSRFAGAFAFTALVAEEFALEDVVEV